MMNPSAAVASTPAMMPNITPVMVAIFFCGVAMSTAMAAP